MQSLVRLSKILAASSGIAALALAAGCSCGSSTADPDGAIAVDAPGEADAEPDPVLLRSGTIALFQNHVQVAAGLSFAVGATVAVTMSDEETRTVFPLDLTGDGMPDSQVGGCAITVFDVAAGDEPPDATDEGSFTITGTGQGPFVCAVGVNPLSPDKYACRTTDEGGAGQPGAGSLANKIEDTPLATYQITGADFSEANYVGQALVINAFGEESPANGAFAIVRQGGVLLDNQLVVFNSELEGLAGPTAEAGGVYFTLVGEGPIPVSATDPEGGFDTFIDGRGMGVADDVTIVGAASSDILDEINLTFQANGEGLVLRVGGDFSHPAAIPLDGEPVKFGCQGAACGPSLGGSLNALIINGLTTDGELPAAADDPFGTDMPDPVSKFATFQCSIFSAGGDGSREATLTAEAMAAILGTNPTRIQTAVAHVGGVIETNAAGTSSVNVLAGHAITGFTTVPPPD
jgi:hypothetical protein